MKKLEDSAYAEMLILAALTYRGFSDILRGKVHAAIVRKQITDGLEKLSPVCGKWELVWGPSVTRLGGEVDSSAMYVVRHRKERNRYIIAVRGTNPISLRDWTYGDMNVGTTVSWPFSDDGAVLSTSTAHGLRTLIRARWAPPESLTGIYGEIYHAAIRVTSVLFPGIKALIRSTTKLQRVRWRRTFVSMTEACDRVVARAATAIDLPKVVGAILGRGMTVRSDELSRLQSKDDSEGTSLFEFLSTAAKEAEHPIDVTVTGHSKGGALAPVLALWLTETRFSSQPNADRWDRLPGSAVGCVSFAGPTPGNTAFASHIEKVLGDRYHRVFNTKDVVPHVWQVEDMVQIPDLYGGRSAALRSLVEMTVSAIRSRNYAHSKTVAVPFSGQLDATRTFMEEFVFQHLDAYLAHFYKDDQIDALTFFLN